MQAPYFTSAPEPCALQAAIFGAPATGSHEKLQQSSSPPPREADSDSEERPQIVELLEVQPQALPGADVDVSERTTSKPFESS